MTYYWTEVAAKARQQQRPFFSLAPMEAVTNTIFRQVVAHAAAPDVFFTEFTNAKSITHPKAKFSVAGRLYVAPEEQSMPVVQLWGDEALDFEKAAYAVRDMGYQAIDLNTGCPDSTVIKNHGGSDFIRHPETAREAIAALKKAGLPVSVKTRLGFNRLDEWRDWLSFLLKQDIPLLTVHMRTRKEMSKVPAHYDYLPAVLALRDELAPQTLIQVNGDVADYQAGLALAQQYPGLDGVMIGRGVFNNPFCFESVKREHSLEEMLSLLELQLALYDRFAERFNAQRFAQLKRFFKIYVRGMHDATTIRDQLMQATTTEEVRTILASIEKSH